MRRRDFIALVGGAATAWPFGAQAQQDPGTRRVPRVGFVGLASPAVDDSAILPFRQALKELGYTEGRNIILEIRNAEGDINRGYALIAELAALPVDVFLSPGPAVSRALVRKTDIPSSRSRCQRRKASPGCFQASPIPAAA
jgi:putative ABC transport system substrate-binding protein